MLEARVYHKEGDAYVGDFPIDAYGNTFETVAGKTELLSYLTFDGAGVNLLDNNLKFYEHGDYMGYTLPYISSESYNVNYAYPIKQSEPLTVFSSPRFTIRPQYITVFCEEKIPSYKTVIREIVGYGENMVEGSSESTVLRHYDNKIVIKISEYTTNVQLYFLAAGAPNRYVRISSVFYGTINTFNKFTQHNLLEEINVLSDDLPINQFEATIVNIDNVEFTKKDPLVLFSNNKYYGHFYISDVKRVAQNLYSVKAQNLIGVLEGEEYIDWVSTGPELQNFVKELNNKIMIDDNTKYSLFGYIPVKTKRFALCAACFGCGLMIDGSRSDVIHLKKIPADISSIILTTDRRIIGDAIFEKTEPITSASITYPSDVDTSETGSVTLLANGDGWQFHIFNDAPVLVTETTVGALFYNTTDNYVEFLTENDSATFKYTKYKYLTNTETAVNLLESEGSIKEFKNFQMRGDIIDNGIVTRISRINDIQKYIQSRGKVKAKIRLRNEKVGDLIQIETAWDGIITGIITKMDITFGYEDIANIEVLEWNS